MLILNDNSLKSTRKSLLKIRWIWRHYSRRLLQVCLFPQYLFANSMSKVEGDNKIKMIGSMIDLSNGQVAFSEVWHVFWSVYLIIKSGYCSWPSPAPEPLKVMRTTWVYTPSIPVLLFTIWRVITGTITRCLTINSSPSNVNSLRDQKTVSWWAPWKTVLMTAVYLSDWGGI